MLVLTRDLNEKFIVEIPSGEKLEITLIETRGHQARIGFEGSKEIFKILRNELQPKKGNETDGENAS
ncbi:hypothetical protein GC170_14615 [bacterium]|nr:hypothetical protein [bacterium]